MDLFSRAYQHRLAIPYVYAILFVCHSSTCQCFFANNKMCSIANVIGCNSYWHWFSAPIHFVIYLKALSFSTPPPTLTALTSHAEFNDICGAECYVVGILCSVAISVDQIEWNRAVIPIPWSANIDRSLCHDSKDCECWENILLNFTDEFPMMDSRNNWKQITLTLHWS